MNIKPYMIIKIVDIDFVERFSNMYETIEKDSKYNLSYNLMEVITCGRDYKAYYFDRERTLRACTVNLYSIRFNEDEIYEVVFTVDPNSFALKDGTDFQISLYKYAFYFLPKLGLNGEKIRVRVGFRQEKDNIVFFDEYNDSSLLEMNDPNIFEKDYKDKKIAKKMLIMCEKIAIAAIDVAQTDVDLFTNIDSILERFDDN